jgi:hypothetical protein
MASNGPTGRKRPVRGWSPIRIAGADLDAPPRRAGGIRAASSIAASRSSAYRSHRPTNRPWESGIPTRVWARAGWSVSLAGDALAAAGPGGVAGVAAERGGDVAVAVDVQDADGEVAQARRGAGARRWIRGGPRNA